jgi:ATP-binding cassette subfamily B protein
LITALAEAVVPIAVAWLMKLVLDWLVGGRSAGVVTVGAAAFAATGLAAAVLQRLSGYLRNELGRRMALRALDDLFAATARLVGLARFEDPAFLNRLRLAHQSTSMIGPLIDDTVGFACGAVTLIGFVGTLVVLSPLMTGLVLASAIPALVAQLALSRGRATALWNMEPHHRREFFYGQLLGNAAAAKEIRLFGLADFFRGRMLDERRTSNAALRRVDRRELLVQGLFAAGRAILAGIGLVMVVTAARRGELTTGDIAMFVAAVAGVQSALDSVVRGVAQAHQQLTLFGHYVDVLLVAPDVPIASRCRPCVAASSSATCGSATAKITRGCCAG